MFAGSIVAIVTPMFQGSNPLNCKIDWKALESLIEWHIEQGTHGIISMGTTGESATLEIDEHLKVIEHTVIQVAGRIPVIAGTGANSTREAIELTAAAKRLKADAALLVTPYYNKPTQEGLFLHHEAVAKAVALPQLLYNVPGRTGCDMQAETVRRLSTIDHIVGIKEASGDVARGKRIRELCDDAFILLSGDDESFLDLMAIGAKGNVSVTANVAPKLMSKICTAALAGDMAAAKAMNAQIEALHHNLFTESNPIPVKWALERMGKIDSSIRLPMTGFSVDKQPALEQAMNEAGLI